MSDKLVKAEQLIEKYKNTAKKAVDKYISVQATRFGINESDIKRRLPDNFSFADIDRVCESFKTYKGNLDRLPFSLNETKKNNVKVKVTESVETIMPTNGVDDSIDEGLMSLAGLK